MTLLLRALFLIPIGFVFACVAAGFFFVFAALGFGDDGAYLDRYLMETIVLVAGVSATAGGLAAVPALVAIVIAELLSLRSVLFYLLAGAAIGLAAELAARAPEAGLATADLQLFIASGVVGGFVYWAVAGHGAGRPRRRDVLAPPEQPS